MLLLYLWVFLSCPAAARAQQAGQVEWQDARFFAAADRNAIPALAMIMGIQNPRRVYHGKSVPGGCPYAMVESAYSESGHLRTHLQLLIYRKDWKCAKPKKARSKRVGRWLAESVWLETRKEWKVEGDQWILYVPFEEGVSYEDAELITLAIKHRQLVNRMPGTGVSFQIPDIDPLAITSIQVKSNADRTFEVWSSYGGGGDVYVIRINERSVELLETRIWIA